MIPTSYNFSPFLRALGLTLTSRQMDWPHLKLPDDGDTVHRSPSLSSVDAIVAEQSNHQFTSSFKQLCQYILSSPTALSITLCEERQETDETNPKMSSEVEWKWWYAAKENLFNNIVIRLRCQMFNVELYFCGWYFQWCRQSLKQQNKNENRNMIFTENDKSVTMQFHFNNMKKWMKTLFKYEITIYHTNDHQWLPPVACMHGICGVVIVTAIYLTTCLLLRADREAEVDGVEAREAADHLTPLTLIGISKSYVAA